MPTYRRIAPSVFVSDLDRAVAFYRDGLGFEVVHVDEPPRRVVIGSGDEAAVVHLDLDPAKAGGGSVHVLCDDLDAVADRLATAGVTLRQPPTVQPWGLRELIVADPDGNVWEIAEPVEMSSG